LEPAVVLVGAILLVLCLALGAGLVLSNSDPTTAEAFGVTLSGFTLGTLILTGIVIGALAVLALGMLFGGAARKRRKRSALKREVRTARGEQESLAERNARLEDELQRERTAGLPHDTTTDSSRRARH
jgi:H+/gluconate symporter-like permease